jgi:8-oxo-dGTP pyrophosphatase MutT (NUDIX family)
MSFERISGKMEWKGHIGEVWVDQFRHDDDEVVDREVVKHPGAVVVLPFDGERIWLVRQPREAVGEQALLELPAGKLDVDGEDAITTAQRELREEIGQAAGSWQHLTDFYASPGFTDERIYAFLATDLSEDPLDSDEQERIEVVTEPVQRLDDVIRACQDSKSLVTLLWFRAFILD